MKQNPPSRIQGFTLVELMVVIVIMAIMASLVMLNINGVDQRKAAQARDFFIMDVQKIAREANDQARVLALEVHPATDVADFSYTVVEYKNPQFTIPTEQQNNAMLNHQKWQKYKPRNYLEPGAHRYQILRAGGDRPRRARGFYQCKPREKTAYD